MTDPNLSTRAAELTVQVQALSQSVTALARRQRQDRTIIKALMAGLLLYVVALALIGAVAVQAETAAKKADSARVVAESNREAARLTCEANNQGRAAQVELWTYVLDVSAQANPHPTPAQALRIAQFRAYIQKVFAPRDCSKPIVPTTPAPRTPGTR